MAHSNWVTACLALHQVGVVVEDIAFCLRWQVPSVQFYICESYSKIYDLTQKAVASAALSTISGLPPVKPMGDSDDKLSSSDDNDEAGTEKKDNMTKEVDLEKEKDAFEENDTSLLSQSKENK
jgi:hypothetical protein